MNKEAVRYISTECLMRTASAATRCRGNNLETIHVYKQKKKEGKMKAAALLVGKVKRMLN